MLDDQDLYASSMDPVAVRRTVGMVFQRPNPFPTMSIRDNVAAGLKLNGMKGKKQLDEVVERSLQERQPLEPSPTPPCVLGQPPLKPCATFASSSAVGPGRFAPSRCCGFSTLAAKVGSSRGLPQPSTGWSCRGGSPR